MAFVFGAVSPHTPLILPSIGAAHAKALAKTRTALEALERALYAAQPETIVVLTPHAADVAGAFSISLAQTLTGRLETFGDFTSKLERPADIAFAHRLKERAEDHEIPALLATHETLDYGTTVPLLLLTDHLPKVPVVPIGDSTLDSMAHFRFGRVLKEEIMARERRVAVIASADLAHQKEERAYQIREKVPPYDDAVLRALKSRKGEKLLDLPITITEDADECGFHSLLMLFGLLDHMNYRAEVLSYEAPLGVGFLTAAITLK